MLLRPLFEIVSPDAVEQEVTQQDQFNTDEVTLVETLIRESHQNSSDARLPGSVRPVRIRIAVKEPDSRHADFWRALLGQIKPHLDGCGIEVPPDFGMPRVLVIEDFETTGLTGNPNVKDNSNFQDFWRRIGRSHKGSDKGGSWGLGKIVFPASSRIRAFFGLTIRHDDPKKLPLLMGQIVLRHHSIGTENFHPIGYFAVRDSRGFRVPVSDAEFVSEFANAAGIARSSEPGLSIAIPFAHQEIQLATLFPYVIRNYFFPILTGQLEVEIDGETISAATFDALAAKHAGEDLQSGHLTSFIRSIQQARGGMPQYVLPSSWNHRNMEAVVDSTVLKALRERYASGDLVHVRAPIELTAKAGQARYGEFDLFLRRTKEGEKGIPLFVRGSITVPNEAQFFPSRQVFAALVATAEPVATFLRDAENPAHTRWNGHAEKLRENWRSATTKLTQIRNSLRALYDVLAQAIERTDPDALINILSVQGTGPAHTRRPRHPVVLPPRIPPIRQNPKLFNVAKLRDGFSIKGGQDLQSDHLPLRIKVKAAYDLVRGDPFKKHSPFDFDLTKPDSVNIKSNGAILNAIAANEVILEATDTEFEVRFEGFDTNRDVKVRATRQAQ